MRDLHVLGVTDDGQYLILAESVESGAQFRIPVDGRLRSAVRGHLDDALLEMRPGVELTPREIQTRIRSGESVAELARLSGLPESRIAGFAYPVLAERANAVRDARAARVPDSAATMGDVVDRRLADQGVAESDWDAWRTPDGRWAVQLVYRVYDRLHSAAWIWDSQSRRVTASDAPAQSLLRGGPVAQPDRPAPAGASVVFGNDRPTAPSAAGVSPVRSVPDPAPVPEPEPEPEPEPAPESEPEPEPDMGRDAERQPELPLPEPAGPRAVPQRASSGRSGRRAAIPSWTQIRETAGIPSNQGDAE